MRGFLLLFIAISYLALAAALSTGNYSNGFYPESPELPPWNEGAICLTCDNWAISNTGQRWMLLDWFGLYLRYDRNWIWHDRYQWLYAIPDKYGGVNFWSDSRQEWLWYNPYMYPRYFNRSTSEWEIDKKEWYEYHKIKGWSEY